MAFRCDRCGKGVLIGRHVSHSKKRTRKISLPNLHPVKIWLGGRRVKLRLCTQCLRRVKSAKKGGSRDWPVVAKGDFTGRAVKKEMREKRAVEVATP